MEINHSKSKRSYEIMEKQSYEEDIQVEEYQETFTEQKSKKKFKENPGIKTFCRIRPIKTPNELFKIKEGSDGRDLSVNFETSLIGKMNSLTTFTFSKTFDENSSQQEVFDCTCKALVDDLLEKNKPGLIFTYGMTNAGKTYTVIGSATDPGVLPRSLKYLYTQLESEAKKHLSVFCNFIEIYNEEIYDLLASHPKNKFFKKKMPIKENLKKQFFLPDVTYHKISSLNDFSTALNQGIAKKVHAATNLNQHSSRSHTIFKIILKENITDDDELSLSIVDLAGSERAKRTEAAGKEILEACSINQSLSVLGKCLEAMRHNSIFVNKKIVPFRESKLTKLFQEYFQGEQNIIMITNINPRKEDFEETMRALNYSCIAKDIKPVKSKVVVNPIKKQVKLSEPVQLQTKSPESKINELNTLKSELDRLKEELLFLKQQPQLKEENSVGKDITDSSLEDDCNKITNFNNISNMKYSNNPSYMAPMFNPEMQMLMMGQMMQMMKKMERFLNPPENPMTMFFPSSSPFPLLGDSRSVPIQLENQAQDSSLSGMNDLDMDLIPNKANSFNLVFINSKFNDFHMGNKKRKTNAKNKKKKETNEPLDLSIDLNDLSVTEEIESSVEIREVEAVKDSNDNEDSILETVEEGEEKAQEDEQKKTAKKKNRKKQRDESLKDDIDKTDKKAKKKKKKKEKKVDQLVLPQEIKEVKEEMHLDQAEQILNESNELDQALLKQKDNIDQVDHGNNFKDIENIKGTQLEKQSLEKISIQEIKENIQSQYEEFLLKSKDEKD
jgi:hypothetical protein